VLSTEATRGHTPLAITIRKPKASDQGYVASTWVESLCRANADTTRGGHGMLVDQLLDHPNVRCLLAVDPNRPNDIYGWLVWSPMKAIRLVHFVYTRVALRDRGVAAALRTAAELDDNDRPLVYTMRGPAWMSLSRKYPTAIEQPVKEFLA
jgi:hypothetical protein